jgi:hypothetical protein
MRIPPVDILPTVVPLRLFYGWHESQKRTSHPAGTLAAGAAQRHSHDVKIGHKHRRYMDNSRSGQRRTMHL